MTALISDVRQQDIKWAYYLLHNKARCTYTELPARWEFKDNSIGHLPFEGDCSSTITAICYWAGNPDPSNLDFNYGDTETMLNNAKEKKLIIPQSKLLVADLTFFGWDTPTKPHHVAMALQPGTNKNPSYFSMGEQGDPSIVTLSQLLEIGPATFVRNITKNRHLKAA